tara:strand:- start:76 stop:402 length:327 start_codon:yes stop_codon:yes gene_type:complete
MNDKTYNNLKPKQQLFIQQLYKGIFTDAGDTDVVFLDAYSRQYLKMMSSRFCGMDWAPAWIVKDKSRQVGKGSYSLPELKEWHQMQMEGELPADDGETVIIGTEAVPA